MKKAIVVILMVLILGACSSKATQNDSTNGQPFPNKREMSAKSVIKMDMKSIDLRQWNLACNGRLKQMIDTVEDVTVKGLVCYEEKYASFAYYFNEMPFFYAIMAIDYQKNEMKPLKGFAAIDQKFILKSIPLESKPRLPDWAFGPDGKPLNSIYKDNPKYNRFQGAGQ